MKPNQGQYPREKDLETDITDGNRAIHSSEWMETDLHKSQTGLSLLRKRATQLKENGHFGENGNSATGEKESNLRETELDTTLETKRNSAMLPEIRPPKRRFLGNKKSTIYDTFFGMDCGDDDSAATSGGWQGGGYPTRMKPPCQFSHPALTGNRVPVRSAYVC